MKNFDPTETFETMAIANAEMAVDQLGEYSSAEQAWGEYRSNVEMTAEEMGATTAADFRRAYDAFDDRFGDLSGWHPWK